MRYLVTHQACSCADPTAVVAETPQDVAVYLWGRDVLQHVVYDGECPYFFFTPDVEAIWATLRLYPLPVVRGLLPMIVPVIALRRHGIPCAGDPEKTVCQIGDDAWRFEALCDRGIPFQYTNRPSTVRNLVKIIPVEARSRNAS